MLKEGKQINISTFSKALKHFKTSYYLQNVTICLHRYQWCVSWKQIEIQKDGTAAYCSWCSMSNEWRLVVEDHVQQTFWGGGGSFRKPQQTSNSMGAEISGRAVSQCHNHVLWWTSMDFPTSSEDHLVQQETTSGSCLWFSVTLERCSGVRESL